VGVVVCGSYVRAAVVTTYPHNNGESVIVRKGLRVSEVTKDVSLTISADVVQPIVEAKIQAAIADAMKPNAEALIDAMVDRVMNEKVQSNGKKNHRDDYYNKYPFMETMCNNVLKECAEVAFREWVEAHRPKIIESFKKLLARKHNELAKVMLEACQGAIASKYARVSVSLADKK
jgi:hypothetical protein